MTAPARFLFDTDFAAPLSGAASAEPSQPTITVAEHEAKLAAAEKAARAKGFEDGRNAAESKAAGRLADEAGRLAAAAQSMLAILDVERARIEADALRVAEAVARKLAGGLIEALPREAVLAVFTQALQPLRSAPHVVVRLAAEDAGPIGEAIGAIARERGFAGRLVVLGEPDIGRGDCRIEWADGGIVVDRAALDAAVAAVVAAHVATLDPPAADDIGATE
ncbi:MAG TPA: FliH/SctL family protein [Methylomirabilota bacterium]|nr:FliH/SctL family protein [Methylomirabilota bacterium]